MKSAIAITLAASLLVLSGCSRQKLQVSHQIADDIKPGLKTYALVDHPVGHTPSTKNAFNERIHSVMREKGYILAARQDADLFVSFKTLVMTDGETTSKASPASKSNSDRTIMVGTGSAEDLRKVVLVMLEEASSDEVMWVGWSTNEVRSHRVVPSTTASIDQILARIPRRK